ncbi:S-adenosyl-L-methionine-dependent methyltransferase [Pilobolus umbonatus]|nr:S-adenosyl-L-methionine-dependent methyltransferase [Pilobolus umbonatus]
MGYKKKRGGGKREQEKLAAVKEWQERKGFDPIERNNEKFRRYYKSQKLLSDEEFEEFYQQLKIILPSTFRITGSKSTVDEIAKVVKEKYVDHMHNITIDGEQIEPPSSLPWYPNNLAWKINVPRLVIRKSPEFNEFHKFIVAETEAGNISRQEAVSMVPPLLMDIKPHQWVLDMCAAPGSKTAQIIEAIHFNDKLNEMPVGLVVANDANYKRSHMLIHQLKRLQSPCFMATNHDAAHLPNIHVRTDEISKDAEPLPWQFDRVLCDVPCSGDGTIRKNERIWSNWSPLMGISLHSTQVQIFHRGCQLLKMGGRVVYSTCSFNPIENEAVVAEVLRQTKGAIRLLDVSKELPELKRKPGLKTWIVTNREGVVIKDMSENTETDPKKKLPASVFPPTPQEADQMNLDRCVRIYPHQQDTGGFFIAVFEKVGPLTPGDRLRIALKQGQKVTEADVTTAEDIPPAKRPVEEEEDIITKKAKTIAEDNAVSETEVQPEESKVTLKERRNAPKEAPFEMMPAESTDLTEITKFYGLDSNFPRDQFLLRSGENAKNRSIYFVSKAVKAVLESKDFHRLQTVNTGVRLFVHQNSVERNPFRLTSEGLSLINPVLSNKRRLYISTVELKTLLVKAFPRFEEFSDAIREDLKKMEPGCCVAHIDFTDKKDRNLIVPMILPVWRGTDSLNVLLNKIDKKSLCMRLFDIIPESTPEHLIEKSHEHHLRRERDLKKASMSEEN